jgi:hypothetical protein
MAMIPDTLLGCGGQMRGDTPWRNSRKGFKNNRWDAFPPCRRKTMIRSAFFLEERLKSKKKHLDEKNGFQDWESRVEKHRSRAGLISSSKETT